MIPALPPHPSESQKEAANLKSSLEEWGLHTPQEHAAHAKENDDRGDAGAGRGGWAGSKPLTQSHGALC